MLGVLRSSLACRAAAALLALLLSGASRAALALVPEPEHRCQCRAHGERHRCACRICAEQARRARRGALDRVPPCHRAIVEKELAAEEEDERRDDGKPCLMPSCGAGDPATPPRASVESFTIPAPSLPASAGREEPIPPLAAGGQGACAVPELPPPRP